MRNVYFLILFFTTSITFSIYSQEFTHQDSIRGSITKERIWWDLLHYDLELKVDPENKFISGSNKIKYKVLNKFQTMQIDLQDPLRITKIIQNKKELTHNKDGYAHMIDLLTEQNIGDTNEITVFYEGNPLESVNPPWSGGFTWKKDKNDLDFIATSCQGLGASVWWPLKDHMYDEPDQGALITVTTPKNLMDVSNGRLKNITKNDDDTITYQWEVVNPINNYGINVNIGDYVHFKEIYKGLNGNLDCDYYVLSYNLEKAKNQFQQVPKMLDAFEYWFGPYPFYEDGFKIVEAPYLGMEHQSSVTYGNGYQNGYLGNDFSNTGKGLLFDYIIIHESGHEWFANNITYIDIADMWIHESFTTYSESLYLDYHYGKEAASSYIIGTRKVIKNDKPIIGNYLVNNSGSGDMYFKGANMIHTLRQMINNDDLFRDILRGLNKEFYHQTVTTQQIENYISEKSGLNLDAFFNQYLRDIKIPVLEYKINNKIISYRFNNVVDDFEIPIKILINKEEKWLYPNNKWQKLEAINPVSIFEIDPNFYVNIKELK